jgi:cytoskeletal protein RodZ
MVFSFQFISIYLCLELTNNINRKYISTMSKTTGSTNSRGFAHIEILFFIGVAVIIAIAGITISKHNASTKSTVPVNTKKVTAVVNKPATSTNTTTPKTTTAPATSTNTTTPKTTTAPATSTNTTTPKTTTAPAPAPVPPPAQPTQISALTDKVSELLNTGFLSSAVTVEYVPLYPSGATGRPLVFSFNGQTYFAFTEGYVDGLFRSGSAATIAGQMAIMSASGTYTLTDVSIQKQGNMLALNVSNQIEQVGFALQ